MKRPLRTTTVIGSAVVAAGAVTAAAIGFGGGNSPPASSDAGRTAATASVTRTTLTRTQQVNGTLGYGTPVTVNGRGRGVVTWLPPLGATIRRGQPVYESDNVAVPLFYGGLPLYRQLRSGDTGEDVTEIERNLAALGYSGFTVDTSYTSATASAVRRWQKSLGLTRTGVFDPASVVVAPTTVRVASLVGHLGDPATGAMLTYVGTIRIVSIALDVTLQHLVRPGLPATVTLPTGQTVDGTLATVGTVASAAEEQGEPATIEVTVSVADQSKLGTFDQAPVIVSVVSETAENVLTVPVAALVALAEGGYGVQVVTGATSRYVAVHLGMFADGRVQVTGEGVVEGTLVGVPS
ncbi:peptidoglycan-binding protein [Plantactinospora solaniradicis]|uniref:Peptidoglycan-binding protein n=1 Tax=Plantactinospora solaniradicis TaxID=1723736 RepID=A0ABW1K587_9ACTN